MASHIERRKFLATLGGVAAAWAVAARAQQAALPVIGFVHPASHDAVAHRVGAFRRGLKDTGYVEGGATAGGWSKMSDEPLAREREQQRKRTGGKQHVTVKHIHQQVKSLGNDNLEPCGRKNTVNAERLE
jgi:hypothetical protein